MEEVLQIKNWKLEELSHKMEFLEPILVVHMMAECSRNRKIVQNNKSVVCNKSCCMMLKCFSSRSANGTRFYFFMLTLFEFHRWYCTVVA